MIELCRVRSSRKWNSERAWGGTKSACDENKKIRCEFCAVRWDDDENRERFYLLFDFTGWRARARRCVHTNFSSLLHISNCNYWNFVNTCKICAKFSVFDTCVVRRHNCVSLYFSSFFFFYFAHFAFWRLVSRSNTCEKFVCASHILKYVHFALGRWSWTGWQINCTERNTSHYACLHLKQLYSASASLLSARSLPAHNISALAAAL